MAATTSEPRLTTSEFRKIELQSPADLQHLQDVARRAAREKIDAAFPPSAAPKDGGDDAVRRRVEELVESYLARTFGAVRDGVSVNGVELSGSGENGTGTGEGGDEIEYEPLDTRLKDRVAQLERQKETLTEKVADLRRVVPSLAAEGFKEKWKSEGEAFDTQMATLDEQEVDGTRLNIGELQRLEEVSRTWENGTAGLVGLKTDLTETRAKLERANDVVGVVEEKR